MKTLQQIVNEANYQAIRQDLWENMADDFVTKLKYADETDVISESIYNLIDWIFVKSSKEDHKYLKEGIENWLKENN